MTRSGRPDRRGLLAFAVLAAAMLALPRLLSRLDSEVVALDEAPGFRLLRTDALSVRMDPFIGLDQTPDGMPPTLDPVDLCASLFRDGGTAEAPQIAYFTDANCPQCRILDRWLKDIPDSRAEITVHDLPLLGPTSIAAARAIAAARLMGADVAMRGRLHRSRVVPGAAYLRSVADGMGLDAGRLISYTDRPEVERSIGESLGAAMRLGIPGTPSLVIGDLVVIGRIEEAEFDRLLARYRPAPCDAVDRA